MRKMKLSRGFYSFLLALLLFGLGLFHPFFFSRRSLLLFHGVALIHATCKSKNHEPLEIELNWISGWRTNEQSEEEELSVVCRLSSLVSYDHDQRLDYRLFCKKSENWCELSM